MINDSWTILESTHMSAFIFYVRMYYEENVNLYFLIKECLNYQLQILTLLFQDQNPETYNQISQKAVNKLYSIYVNFSYYLFSKKKKQN